MNKYIYAIISAILMALTITFDKLWWLALIGLIPYFYCLFKENFTLKESFKYGIVFGGTYYFIVLHWIMSMYPLDRYGLSNGESLLALILGWIFLSLYEGIWLAFIPVVFVKLRNNKFTDSILLGFLWILVEWGQQKGVLGFSWGILSMSQVDFTHMIQIASVFGALAITFIIVVINGLITKSIIYREEKNKSKFLLIAVAIILICNISFGSYKLNKEVEGEEVSVGVVQGNISSNDKWNSNSLEKHLKIYLDLSYELANNEENLDYIVWPETAIPITLYKKKDILDRYKELAYKTDANLVVGAYHEEDGKSYNSVYNIEPSGSVSEPYSKRQLVPFGEFLPFENFIMKAMPFLAEVNMFEDAITPGEEAKTLKTSLGDVGSIICFESIFPSLSRELVSNGAEMLVVVTNDSWFKDSRGIYQHLKQSLLRAVENNRYLVRAANTGVSVIIDSKGRVITGIDALKTGYARSEAKLINENSIYNILGDIIVLFAVVFIFFRYIRKNMYHK